jgi:hypothetical protein
MRSRRRRPICSSCRGWALLGFVVVGALVSTLALAILVRARRREFVPASVAFLCIVAAQVLFWTLTFPANQATANWTLAPGNWRCARSGSTRTPRPPFSTWRRSSRSSAPPWPGKRHRRSAEIYAGA